MADIAHYWACIEAVRRKNPLVHNITNLVVMNTAANALLAVGAAPAMIHAPEETGEFVGLVDALVINVGTIYAEMAVGMRIAVDRANALGKPWVLDPVAAGVTTYRRRLSADLAASKPRVIRGNASEILTLASEGAGRGRGVDSSDPVDAAIEAATRLAKSTGSVVAVTGEVDVVTDGMTVRRVAGGDPMLTRVTGMGCALSSVVGAFVGVNDDPLTATAAALACYAVAAEQAVARSSGPGSFQPAMFDALYGLDRDTFLAKARIS
jgi:hydroxyethylthiazole kinase